jgi:hypothetical protein
MGILDRLLGRSDRIDDRQQRVDPASDQAAIARYRYLLRTAPPEAMEQAHAEAFSLLTPDQRRQVLAGLGHELPGTHWARSYDSHSLARIATRAELRRPGALESSFGGGGWGGGRGPGGAVTGSLLASVAGAFLTTAVADALLPDDFGTVPGDLGGDSPTLS